MCTKIMNCRQSQYNFCSYLLFLVDFFFYLPFFSYVRLLCLTNAIRRRIRVKSLSTQEVQHYTPSGPRDWLDILRQKWSGDFYKKNVRRKLFFRADTFHLHEHKKDKFCEYNDQQHRLMNVSHYERRPSYFLMA